MSVKNFSEVLKLARELSVLGERRILGIVGAPGSGKSTLASCLFNELGPNQAALFAMDGFHLSDETLVSWGRRERKGAWDTFDAAGYVATLSRLKMNSEAVVHVPIFNREIEESIGSAIPIEQSVPLVITEGNYLLSEVGCWGEVSVLLDESWYLEIDERTRLERLTSRHLEFGKEFEDARSWVNGPDQKNAELIQMTAIKATRTFKLEETS